jgi:hypothetical protein
MHNHFFLVSVSQVNFKKNNNQEIMRTYSTDTKMIRFEIDNFDEKIEDLIIEEILFDLSAFTAKLIEKYDIPCERFNLTVGSNTIDKLLKL